MIPDPFIRERSGADPLVEGFYLLRRRGRTDVPVRVWYGAPEEDGQPLDRSFRWQIQVGFQLLDDEPILVGGISIDELTDVWPTCAKFPVDQAEWRYRLERAEWAASYDSNDAFADLGARIDPMTCTLP